MSPPAANRLPDGRAHEELLMTGDQAVPGWRSLEPGQRWTWFQQLYEQAAHLDRRYRLGLRSGWWTDEVQVELLAALAAWVGMFDYANGIDPEAKARLIFQLPALRELLRGGPNNSTPSETDMRSSSTSAKNAIARSPTMRVDDQTSDARGRSTSTGRP